MREEKSPDEFSKRADFAIAAYNAARSEVLEHVKLRETALRFHILLYVTISGVYFTALRVEGVFYSDWQYIFALFLPLLSLLFSYVVAQHNYLITRLANFIAFELNDSLKRLGIWGPHWDDHVARNANIVKQKKRSGLLKTATLLHAPTAAMFIIATVLESFRNDAGLATPMHVSVFLIGVLIWFGAMKTTIASYKIGSRRPKQIIQKQN